MAGLLSTPLNNTTSTGQFIGDALAGLGAGLLAYGGGGALRPQAGLIGLQTLQQAPQVRQERQLQNLQYQLGNQQLQQGSVNNALNNYQTLALINWRNSKSGLPPVSMNDFMANPQKALSSLYGTGDASQVASNTTPQPIQATPLPPVALKPLANGTVSANPQNPYSLLSAGSAQMPQSPQAQPIQSPQIAPTTAPQQPSSYLGQSGLDANTISMIQQDALYNPEFAKTELALVQAGLPYTQAKAQVEQFAKDYRTVDAQGNIINQPGAVQAGAQVAGANSYATSQGQLPAQMTLQTQRGQIERTNDINKANITPYVQTIQTGPSTFQQVNTNQLSASRSQAAGEMKYTPEQTGNQQKLTEYKSALTDASNEAQGQNVQLNQMLDTMKGFNPSRVADYTASLQGWMNGLGIASDEQTKALSNYQEFSKLATKLSTSQARQLGAREAASVIQMVVRNNPNAQMTPQAITDMLNAMKASNDYAIAKNQAADQYYQQYGTTNGFDAAYQKQHPPVEALAPYLRPEQLKGELGKAALPYLSNNQLIQLRQSIQQ